MTSLWLDGTQRLGSDPLPPGAEYDHIVVGAGLTGLVTALLLAQAGRRVAVLERRHAGAVTTGNTTAKISLLQGTTYSRLLRYHSRNVAAAYLDGNREAFSWLLSYCREHGVPVQRRDAYTYATTEPGASAVREEYEAARQVGLEVSRGLEEELPFQVTDAIRLPEQAQFDPLNLLPVLVSEMRAHGGILVEECPVTDLHLGERVTVDTPAGQVTGAQVVLATGLPFADRGLYFAKVTPERSYALAFAVPGDIPAGMYLSADQPTRSLRTAPHAEEELLLVGGNGHPVGRHPRPPSALVEDLRRWTEQWFPGAEQRYVWSAQDYASHNGVPFVGRLPRAGGKVFLATGYSKWGMTNAVASAVRLSSEVAGVEPYGWARTLGTRISKPASGLRSAQANLAVGAAAVQGWAQAELHPLSADDRRPTDGQGVVGQIAGRPVAVSTVEGRTCAVSAVCTHLGGILRFNDLERSWDCPLHGSRFAADGSVLEGPATQPLAEHALSTESA